MRGYFWLDYINGLFRYLILRPIQAIGEAQEVDGDE